MLNKIFPKGPVFCFGGGGGGGGGGGDGPVGKSSNSGNSGMGNSPSSASNSNGHGPSDNEAAYVAPAPVVPDKIGDTDLSPPAGEKRNISDIINDPDYVGPAPLPGPNPTPPLPDVNIEGFDAWLGSQSDNTKNAGYGTQHSAYKKSVQSQLDGNVGRKFKNGSTFADYDPGLFLADDSYGDFSGSYRNQEGADGAFQDYYSGQIEGLGYGNLVQDGMSNDQYVSALTEATGRKKFGDLITGLGYGSTYDTSMSSGNLESLYGDVQERKRLSGLLDDMGYDYDANDDATGLGYNYNQAVAMEDTKSKLQAARSEYSGLENSYNSAMGEMDGLQGQFDDLFGDYGSLTTDYGGLQGTYEGLSGKYNRLEGTQKATKDRLAAKAGEYDALSGLYDTLQGNYGTQTTDYADSISRLGELQGNYDQLGDDKSALQGTYDELFGNYGQMGKDKAALQGNYDDLQGQYGTLGDQNSALQGNYDDLQGQYGTLGDQNSALQGNYDALQSNYGTLGDQNSALQGDYDDLQGQYGTLGDQNSALQGQYGSLSDSFDALTGTQGRTMADLEAEREAALGLRGQMRGNESTRFLAGTAADFDRRSSVGLGSVEPEYTAAMDALDSTELDPRGYQMSPIDFAGGFDPSIMEPTAMGGLADLGAYGTTDYTDIFAGPQMTLDRGEFDLNQSFNPYFEALNQEYGVNIPPTNYGPRTQGGQN